MKEHFFNALRGFVSAMTAAAIGVLVMALMLALYDIERTVVLAVIPLAALLLVQALLNEALCTRSVSMLAYALVNGALLLLGAHHVVTHTVFIPASGGFPVLLRMIVVGSGLIGAYSSQKLPGSNVFVRCGDALIIATAFYLGTVFMLGEAFHLPILSFALVTFALSMLLAASLRAGGESESVIRGTGMGGYLVLLFILGACAALAAVLLSLAGGHVSSLVDVLGMIWSVILRAGSVLLELFGRFIALFVGKPRMMERQYVQQDSLAYQAGPMEEMGTAPEWVVYLIMGLIGALVLAGIIAILYAMRSVKIGRTARKRSRRRVTRKSHLLSALLELLRRLVGVVSFEMAYHMHRKTPQGLFVLARRTCRMKRLPKRRSESAGAYLRRLHGVLLSQGHASSLDELAALLDRVLYGGEEAALTSAQYEAFASQIRAISVPKKNQSTRSEPG